MTTEPLVGSGAPSDASRGRSPWVALSVALAVGLLGAVAYHARKGAVSPRIANPDVTGVPRPVEFLFGWPHWLLLHQVGTIVMMLLLAAVFAWAWRRRPAHPYLLMVLASSWGMDVGGLYSQGYATAPWSWDKFVDLLKHLWIPVIVISAGSTAWLTRVMRANLLDVLNMQYIQTARAKGLQEGTVIWKHAVRNGIHPLVMALGGVLPALISGEVLVSIVLNLALPGKDVVDHGDEVETHAPR